MTWRKEQLRRSLATSGSTVEKNKRLEKAEKEGIYGGLFDWDKDNHSNV
jgi:hypothetical protein